MKDIQLFLLFFIFLIAQRTCELFIAKKNEKWMKEQGALEFGQKGYKYIVAMHVLFLFGLLVEKLMENRSISMIWPWLCFLFIITQLLRFWALFSLGKYWNTKIIVLPNANIICKGPYRFMRHPNYLVVVLELLTIPLLFNAYLTAILFTFLNIMLLAYRIYEEEKALKNLTEYEVIFGKCNRFIPTLFNKGQS